MSKPIVGQPDVEQGNRGWFTPRNISIVGVVALVLVVGAIVAWQMYSRSNKQSAAVRTAMAESQAAYNKSEFVNALNIMKVYEKKAVGNKQKSQVYQLEAQAAAGAGKLTDAVKYYELKHKVAPDSIKPDALMLGTIYERLGQKDKAIAQYKLAIEFTKTQKNQYGSDATAIQASIDALEQKK